MQVGPRPACYHPEGFYTGARSPGGGEGVGSGGVGWLRPPSSHFLPMVSAKGGRKNFRLGTEAKFWLSASNIGRGGGGSRGGGTPHPTVYGRSHKSLPPPPPSSGFSAAMGSPPLEVRRPKGVSLRSSPPPCGGRRAPGAGHEREAAPLPTPMQLQRVGRCGREGGAMTEVHPPSVVEYRGGRHTASASLARHTRPTGSAGLVHNGI